MRTKVRFNLSRGENYMKWKVMYNNGEVVYYHPTEVQILMRGCTLKNSKIAAERIYTGKTSKMVCAWILCDEVSITTENFRTESNSRLCYNPRVLPFWSMEGKDMDNQNVENLFTINNKLYLV